MSDRCTRLDHSIVSENGAILSLPPYPRIVNLNVPQDDELYEQSVSQLYPLGTKLEYADGRIFRYGKAGATSTGAPIARLVGNMNLCPGATGDPDVDGFEGDPYTAAAVGDTDVDLEIATAYAAGFFEDGMLAVYPSGHYVCYRIHDSDLGNGTYCRVYLDAPLKTALAADTGITAYKSRWSQMKQIGAEATSYVSALGVCLASGFTSAYYMWVQTRGRAIITPTAYFGDAVNQRLVMFNPADGTIEGADVYDPSTGHQIIGYLDSRTESGYGDLLVFLTLE